MAPRASWKGYLKVAELACPVSLHTAASTSDRIAFHTLNRATGHRVRRQFVDQETGKPVDAEDQVKGYEIGQNDYVVLEPDEIAAAVPESDKTLAVEAFIGCDDIDTVYFDRPYYLSSGSAVANEAYSLLRDGMRARKAAALARTVLFRRVRALLIRPYEDGLIATTLHFDYEIRSAEDAFRDVPALQIKGEMLDLAKHIIATKRGDFDPQVFDDRYESALADLVRAKLAGEPIEISKPAKTGKVIDLMEALRQSASAAGATKHNSPAGKKPAKAPATKSSASTGRQRRRAS